MQKMHLKGEIGNVVMAISANGRRIATGNYQTNIISLWDAATGECLQTIVMQDTTLNFLHVSNFGEMYGVAVDTIMNRVDNLALSSDGSRLVSGSTGRNGGTVCVWDANTGACEHILKDRQAHRNSVWANALVAISANGKIILSCCDDNKIRVWNGDSGNLLNILQGIMQNLCTLAISADGMFIVSGSLGQVRLWETSTGELRQIINTNCSSRSAGSVSVAHQYWTRRTHRYLSNGLMIAAIASNMRCDVVLPKHMWEYVFEFLNGPVVVAYSEYTHIAVNYF
jgi:WD40 repeat protein